eukprot:GILI01018708.1.p1 GENE.GILI01018708.1~~GILI01018708.1.p1  ORF type:complete len:469 (-),score=67.76 GILI01018708.1:205-1557(-)
MYGHHHSQRGPVTPRQPIRDLIREKNDMIYDAFMRFDRGMLSLNDFRRVVRDEIGVPENHEYVRYLQQNGPGGTLSFAKIIQTLCLADADDRKVVSAVAAQNPSQRPVSASTRIPEPTEDDRSTRKAMGAFYRGPTESNIFGAEGAPRPDTTDSRAELSLMIKDYIQGLLPSTEFRRALYMRQIPITQHLDGLIRNHDAHNSGRFQDFAKLIIRELPDPKLFVGDEDRNRPRAMSPHRAANTYGDIIGWNEYPDETAVMDDMRRARVPGIYDRNSKANMSPLDYAPFSKGLIYDHPAAITHGDIISWQGGSPAVVSAPQHQPNDEVVRPGKRIPQQASRAQKTHGDIITWSSTAGEALPADDVASRPLRRSASARIDSTASLTQQSSTSTTPRQYPQEQTFRPSRGSIRPQSSGEWFKEPSTQTISSPVKIVPPFGVDHVRADHYGRLAL